MKQDYSNEHSSASVSPFDPMPGVLEVASCRTEHGSRRQGYGTKLMQEICGDADIERQVIVLMPKAYDGGPKELDKFYGRFGFIKIQRAPVLMARMPHIFKVRMSEISQAVEAITNG